MKTKIIYISGNEIFDMNDIRAAFEEVRLALNLDNSTVLFGVPVDADDAGLMSESKPQVAKTIIEDIKEEKIVKEPIAEEIIPITVDEEIVEETIEDIVKEEPVAEEQPKKRGRPRKETVVQKESEPVIEQTESENLDEKVVPILSILSTNDESDEPEETSEEIEVIPENIEEKTEEEIIAEPIKEPVEDIAEESEEEADLEKLLSAMTPLQEDVSEEPKDMEQTADEIAEPTEEPEDISVDATLEQLATEFAETQDKIATENKSSSRSKIGKLRNILPFKQSKHKDQGLGDLFGWAGIAANDEEFSVPGFFTNAASRK